MPFLAIWQVQHVSAGPNKASRYQDETDFAWGTSLSVASISYQRERLGNGALARGVVKQAPADVSEGQALFLVAAAAGDAER